MLNYHFSKRSGLMSKILFFWLYEPRRPRSDSSTCTRQYLATPTSIGTSTNNLIRSFCTLLPWICNSIPSLSNRNCCFCSIHDCARQVKLSIFIIIIALRLCSLHRRCNIGWLAASYQFLYCQWRTWAHLGQHYAVNCWHSASSCAGLLVYLGR